MKAITSEKPIPTVHEKDIMIELNGINDIIQQITELSKTQNAKAIYELN